MELISEERCIGLHSKLIAQLVFIENNGNLDSYEHKVELT